MNFHFISFFNDIHANRIAANGTPHFAASHLGLLCLPMSHKKDVRLIWVKLFACLPQQFMVAFVFSVC